MKYYNDQALFDEHDDSQMSRWYLKFAINTSAPTNHTLSFRVPAWVSGNPAVEISGVAIDNVKIENGYINISKDWENDTVNIFFPSKLTTAQLADMPELTAIVDGPIVLVGLVDED